MLRIILLVILLIIFAPRILANLPEGGGWKSGKEYQFTTPSGSVYNLFVDALKQPHLLIAGVTGSGKSVIMNGLIDTLMYRLPFDQAGNAQLILIDPKRVELSAYKDLPHTIARAAGYNPPAWSAALKQAVSIMDYRYSRMENNRQKMYAGSDVYVFIDEWASINSKSNPLRKDCVSSLLRLVSEGRAARVHVILATQVPKANIIPTEIRENFSARFALRTANAVQSRVIMEASGCESLPRFGQGFYVKPEGTELYNIPFVKDEEIKINLAWWDDQVKQNQTPHRARLASA